MTGVRERTYEIFRSEWHLVESGVITAREAVETIIARLTRLDVELRLVEREAEVRRAVAGLDEALARIFEEAEQ